MKVLKIIHTLGHGGAENTFRRLGWGLRRAGVEVVAAIPVGSTPGVENWISPALAELDVPVITFDGSGSPWKFLKNLGAVIDQVQPDVVHSHLLDSNFYSALACRRRSIPHVSTEHGDVSLKQTAVSRVKYGAISLCSRYVVCVSNAVREKAAGSMLIKGRLRTIYNGIQFLEKSNSSFRAEFGIPEDAVLIGNVGNLYPVKGQRFLIRALAEICGSYPGVYLALVGRGGEEDSLRQLVRDLGLPSGQVVFTGFRRDVENVMNAFDLYVQPSLSEGHPLAVLEAMSLGVPVIASAVGGVPEITGGERYGALVPPGSADALSSKIRVYLDSRESFVERAALAQGFVRSEFSIEKMVGDYIHCYRDALKGGQKLGHGS